MTEEREFIEIKNMDEMWQLKEMLDIKETNCKYCDIKINKGDKFSIYNKPTEIICSSILCVSSRMVEKE